MNFENKIKDMISVGSVSPDTTKFLDRLHHKREKQYARRHRFVSGMSALSLILITGFLTFSQLDIGSEIYVNESTLVEKEIYVDELTLMLLDYDDDIWNVYELLEEINHESVLEI